jgi:hypothetical protein
MKLITETLIFIFIVSISSGCEEIIKVDVDPQLQITVKDESDNIVVGAAVNLFDTEEDFLLNENEVMNGTTDAAGQVLFKELSEEIYYFYAEKDELNNYYEVVTFAEPLKKNEIKTITCIIR